MTNGLPDLDPENVVAWIALLMAVWCLGFDPDPLVQSALGW